VDWATVYGPEKQPSESAISQFVDSPQWAEIHSFLRGNYEIQPSYSYSVCSAQPGWNVKYHKAGRSLCTLYPMQGYFIALVVIGSKEMNEAELILPTLSEYTRSLFETTVFSVGGKWLMINVTDEQILEDVKRLIQVRRKLKQ
jgi:hypothetical protein